MNSTCGVCINYSSCIPHTLFEGNVSKPHHGLSADNARVRAVISILSHSACVLLVELKVN